MEVKNGGSIEGTVEFAGANVPKDQVVKVMAEYVPYCGDTLFAERYLIKDRKIKNAVVYIEGIKAGRQVPSDCQLWNTATARQMATLEGFLQGAHSVTFSPDGRRLAIGSNGNEAIKLWDVESLQELLTLKGQGSMFNSTAFSPDGNVLASSNSQGILHLWRAPSFEDSARLGAQGR